MRADPATFERDPPAPPAHLLGYTDWRAAYFDESACQPFPGVPLCGARSLGNVGRRDAELIQPAHPSPQQLLKQHSSIRSYLTQLVLQPCEQQPVITEADFWARYYYRVWLLDVTERRRQRLTEGNRGSPTEDSADDWLGLFSSKYTVCAVGWLVYHQRGKTSIGWWSV